MAVFDLLIHTTLQLSCKYHKYNIFRQIHAFLRISFILKLQVHMHNTTMCHCLHLAHESYPCMYSIPDRIVIGASGETCK